MKSPDQDRTNVRGFFGLYRPGVRIPPNWENGKIDADNQQITIGMNVYRGHLSILNAADFGMQITAVHFFVEQSPHDQKGLLASIFVKYIFSITDGELQHEGLPEGYQERIISLRSFANKTYPSVTLSVDHEGYQTGSDTLEGEEDRLVCTANGNWERVAKFGVVPIRSRAYDTFANPFFDAIDAFALLADEKLAKK